MQELGHLRSSHQEGNPALEQPKGEWKKSLFAIQANQLVDRGAIQRKSEDLISYSHCVLLRVLFSVPAQC